MNKRVEFSENIIEFSTLETNCVYQSGKRMKMRYKYIKDPPLFINSKLIQDGWRRFGNYFSKPICKDCTDCLSLRIDVKNFRFSKSQRRVFKKNKDTKIIIRRPSITKEHLELYEKYHIYMEEKKGWEYIPITPENYKDLYMEGASFYGKEVLYFIDGKLVGVDLIDFLEDGISAIYFFYDPDYAKYSLGKYSLLKEIEFAKKLDLDWIYLGYAVKNCNSLNYKFEYKPYQILQSDNNWR